MCGMIPIELILVIHNFFRLFWFIIIIFLIVSCLIDMLKILMSQDESEIRKYQNMIIKRIIAGILIFIFIYILQFIFLVLQIHEANEAFMCAKHIIYYSK